MIIEENEEIKENNESVNNSKSDSATCMNKKKNKNFKIEPYTEEVKRS